MRKTVWLILMLLAQSLPVSATDATWVRRGVALHQGRFWVEQDECSVPVRSGGRLTARADVGSVMVVAGATNQVRCAVRLTAYTPAEAEARASFGRAELRARPSGGDSAFLEFRYADQDHPLRRLDAALFIQVPDHMDVDVETQGGGITVESLDGDLRAVTAGGDIRTGDVTGPVRLQTAAGDINVGNISQRITAHTAGGSIHVGNVKGDAFLETSGGEIVSGLIGGTVHAETAAGDIVLRGVSGPVIVQTAGGQIQLGDCGGPVRAQTAAGSIHLDGARGRVDAETAGGSLDLLGLMSGVRAQTAAGHILAQIDASRQTFTASTLESSVGDLQVFLPSDLPITVKAMIDSSMGHAIASDFPLTERRESGDLGLGPLQASGTLAGGGAPLNLHTSLGSIEIRKQDAESQARLKAYQQRFWNNWQERIKEQQANLDRMQKAMQQAQQRFQEELQRAMPDSDQ
ncbi:MAG TPA: hypothetical protein VI455_09825 [Terriglobia bacterium]